MCLQTVPGLSIMMGSWMSCWWTQTYLLLSQWSHWANSCSAPLNDLFIIYHFSYSSLHPVCAINRITEVSGSALTFVCRLYYLYHERFRILPESEDLDIAEGLGRICIDTKDNWYAPMHEWQGVSDAIRRIQTIWFDCLALSCWFSVTAIPQRNTSTIALGS